MLQWRREGSVDRKMTLIAFSATDLVSESLGRLCSVTKVTPRQHSVLLHSFQDGVPVEEVGFLGIFLYTICLDEKKRNGSAMATMRFLNGLPPHQIEM